MNTKRLRKLKLKPRPESGYPPDCCAIDGCSHPSDVIDATMNVWDCDVPMCDDDYARRPPPPFRAAEPLPEPKKDPEPAPIPVKEEVEEEIEVIPFPVKVTPSATVDKPLSAPKSHKLFG